MPDPSSRRISGTPRSAPNGMRGLVRERMAGGQRDDEPVDVVAPHREAAIVHRAFDEPEIDSVLHHHLHDAVGVGHQEIDADLREPLLEAHEQPRQVVLRDGHARAEHQRAGHVVGELPERAVHLGVQREDAGCVLLHPPSRRGQLDLVVLAVEEPGVEVLLELADLKGHRRLGHVQPLAGAGEALELRDRVEHLQAAVDHGVCSERRGASGGDGR